MSSAAASARSGGGPAVHRAWPPARSRTRPAGGSRFPTGSSASSRRGRPPRGSVRAGAGEDDRLAERAAAEGARVHPPAVSRPARARPPDRPRRHRQPRARAQGQARPHPRLRLGRADTYVSLADRVQEQTGIPYRPDRRPLRRTPAALRLLGDVLGVGRTAAEALARYVEETFGGSTRRSPTTCRRRRAGASTWRAGRTGSRPGDAARSTPRSSSAPAASTSPSAGRARRHRQRLDRAGARLGARHHHHLGPAFLRRLCDRPGVGRGAGRGGQARLPGAAPAVRLDRRAAVDQPRDRAALARRACSIPTSFPRTIRERRARFLSAVLSGGA